MALLHAQLTGAIIGAYYAVYNGISRTYPEYIYEKALVYELWRRGIKSVRQDDYAVLYKDVMVGRQILDIFVADQVVVELKAVPKLARLHAAQTMSYLKVTGNQVGLLFNFGSIEPEFKRIFFSHERQKPANTAVAPEQAWPDLLYPEISYEIIGAMFEVHNTLGPGLMRRIYANALYRELQIREMAAMLHRHISVSYRGHGIGTVEFDHLLVAESVMVFPVAIGDVRSLQLENLRLWMTSQEIRLGILANFQALRLDLHFMGVYE